MIFHSLSTRNQIFVVLFAAVIFAVSIFVFQFCWNLSMILFGLPSITFVQAAAFSLLLFLSGCFVKTSVQLF